MTRKKPGRFVADPRDQVIDVAVGHVSSSHRGGSKSARKLSRVVAHRSNIKWRKLS